MERGIFLSFSGAFTDPADKGPDGWSQSSRVSFFLTSNINICFFIIRPRQALGHLTLVTLLSEEGD